MGVRWCYMTEDRFRSHQCIDGRPELTASLYFLPHPSPILTPNLLFQCRHWGVLLTHLGLQGICHPSIPLPLTSTLLHPTVVGKIIDPLRCPNHWHVICYFTYKKRHSTMSFRLRTLRWENILQYPGESNPITLALKIIDPIQVAENQRDGCMRRT